MLDYDWLFYDRMRRCGSSLTFRPLKLTVMNRVQSFLRGTVLVNISVLGDNKIEIQIKILVNRLISRVILPAVLPFIRTSCSL
jgi:hypothetical protein